MSLGFGFEIRGANATPIVTVIEPGGPAAAAGIRVGDSILKIDGTDVRGSRVDPRDLLVNNNPFVQLELQSDGSFLSQGMFGLPAMAGFSMMQGNTRTVTVQRRFNHQAEEAAKQAKQDANLSPAAITHRDRGRNLFKEGNYRAACEAFTHALMASPTAHQLLTNRALCNQKLGRWIEVEEDARQALRCNSSSVKAYYLLGKALLEMGRSEEAMKELLASMSHSSSPEFKSYRWSIEAALYLARRQVWEKEQSKADSVDMDFKDELMRLAEECQQEGLRDGDKASEARANLELRTHAIEQLFATVREKRSAEDVPRAIVCPMTKKVMIDPVTTPSGQVSTCRTDTDIHCQTMPPSPHDGHSSGGT